MMKYTSSYKLVLSLFLTLLITLSSAGQNPPFGGKSTPGWAVKSNLLYDATTSMNLGIELKAGRKLTLELPVSYNPFTFGDNRKWKHILIQPELRYWLCEPFSGHFFGLHTHYAFYNVGNSGSSWMRKYRFEGWLAGAGLSYGYQFFLSRRWNLEVSLGMGYAYLSYERYHCRTCGEFIGKENKHYFGPTKAALSLIYIIK